MLFLLFLCPVAFAHEISSSLVAVAVGKDGGLTATWQAPVAAVSYLWDAEDVSLADGLKNAGLHREDIAGDLLVDFHISNNDSPCAPKVTGQAEKALGDQAYVILELVFSCSKMPLETLAIDYKFGFDHDASHIGLLNLAVDGKSVTHRFTNGERSFSFDLREINMFTGFTSFVRQGFSRAITDPVAFCFWIILLLSFVTSVTTTSSAAYGASTRLGVAVTGQLVAMFAASWFGDSAPSVPANSALALCGVALGFLVLKLSIKRQLYWAQVLLTFVFGIVLGLSTLEVAIAAGLPLPAPIGAIVGLCIGLASAYTFQVALVFPFLLKCRRNK
jgi:hypothetical protein